MRLQDSQFLIYDIQACPGSYINSTVRDELFEIIWFEESGYTRVSYVYLIPPFRDLEISLEGKKGHLIAFKREYLDEDDKDYALEVFKLFNLQGQYSFITLDETTQHNLVYLFQLVAFEHRNTNVSYVAIKALLKVFLIHLIRLTQKTNPINNINQKRVYEFCMLLDKNYYIERKASFYSGSLGISEKRLNQILQKKMKKTITQLIHSRLVLEAKRKIISGELTIKEISNALNFEDHSYFSRFFRKQTGLSPDEFKKNALIGIQR